MGIPVENSVNEIIILQPKFLHIKEVFKRVSYRLMLLNTSFAIMMT